jgi:hypothetical protein
MRFYTPKYFSVQEWVPPEIYADLGDSAIILLDDRILKIWDGVREHFDAPVTINSWDWGGCFSQRGFRTVQQPGGAKHSPHFYGRAGDGDVKGFTAEQIREEILHEQNSECFSFITGIEMNVNWIHLDCSNRCSSNGIVQFNH